MFPLAILPLPGELVPLHIFEPRYQQLLEEAEKHDISFGIFFNHTMNTSNAGSLVRLESIIKKYPTGESDVIVKCIDLFTLDTLYKVHQNKLYPAGLVDMWEVDIDREASVDLIHAYIHYLDLRRIKNHSKEFTNYQIVNELGLDFEDRLKFISFNDEKKEIFLLARLKYQKHLLLEAEKAKDVFHLN